MRHRPEINFTASSRTPPKKFKMEGGYGLRVECTPRDYKTPDYDLGFHCQNLALKSCMRLWGLSQINPLMGGYHYDEVLSEDFFDETTTMAPNARRYIEIFDDRELADRIVGSGNGKDLRLWDALGLIIHGRTFVAGYTKIPDHPVVIAIHELLAKSLDGALTDDETAKLEALGRAQQGLPPMRQNVRLVGYTITSDRKQDYWVSVEAIAQSLLEHTFRPLTEWRSSATDFRTPVEE